MSTESVKPTGAVDVTSSSSATSSSIVPSRTAPHELVRLVETFCQASTLRKRTAALIALVHWTRQPGVSMADLSGISGFVEYLEANTEEKKQFQAAFADLLLQVDCISLFAEAGIPSDHSFVTEIGHRISSRLLPSAREQSDAAKLLVTLYPTKRNVRRFLASSPELFQRLVAVLTPPSDPQFASHEYQDLLEAFRLLSARVMRRRSISFGCRASVGAAGWARDMGRAPHSAASSSSRQPTTMRLENSTR